MEVAYIVSMAIVAIVAIIANRNTKKQPPTNQVRATFLF